MGLRTTIDLYGPVSRLTVLVKLVLEAAHLAVVLHCAPHTQDTRTRPGDTRNSGPLLAPFMPLRSSMRWHPRLCNAADSWGCTQLCAESEWCLPGRRWLVDRLLRGSCLFPRMLRPMRQWMRREARLRDLSFHQHTIMQTGRASTPAPLPLRPRRPAPAPLSRAARRPSSCGRP